jgi:hypothetical protein
MRLQIKVIFYFGGIWGITLRHGIIHGAKQELYQMQKDYVRSFLQRATIFMNCML